MSTDAAGFAIRYGPLICFPRRGFRRWASTRPVSRPSRQPATGPPGSYPDRTHTGRRRRALSDHDHIIDLRLWANSVFCVVGLAALAIADIATRGVLPVSIQHNLAAWAGCVAGALDVEELQSLLVAAGYADADVQV